MERGGRERRREWSKMTDRKIYFLIQILNHSAFLPRGRTDRQHLCCRISPYAAAFGIFLPSSPISLSFQVHQSSSLTDGSTVQLNKSFQIIKSSFTERFATDLSEIQCAISPAQGQKCLNVSLNIVPNKVTDAFKK